MREDRVLLEEEVCLQGRRSGLWAWPEGKPAHN